MADDDKRIPPLPKLYQNPRAPKADETIAAESESGVLGAKVATINGKKVKFFDSYWTFAIAVLVVGPFALPMFWRNPRASRDAKVNVTVVVAVLTAISIWMAVKGIKKDLSKVQEFRQQMIQLEQGGIQ